MNRFVWVDLETTGLSPKRDEILAIGLIITDERMREIARFDRVIHVPAGYLCMRDMVDVVRDMHTKNGLLERVADSRCVLADVEIEACAFLDRHLGEVADEITARPPAAGSSVHFDLRFIVEHMPRLAIRFNRRVLDVSSFKVLALATVPGAKAWNDAHPEAAHMPLADLEASIAELAHWRQVLASPAVGPAKDLADLVLAIEENLAPESEEDNGEILVPAEDWRSLVEIAKKAPGEGSVTPA